MPTYNSIDDIPLAPDIFQLTHDRLRAKIKSAPEMAFLQNVLDRDVSAIAEGLSPVLSVVRVTESWEPTVLNRNNPGYCVHMGFGLRLSVFNSGGNASISTPGQPARPDNVFLVERKVRRATSLLMALLTRPEWQREVPYWYQLLWPEGTVTYTSVNERSFSTIKMVASRQVHAADFNGFF